MSQNPENDILSMNSLEKIDQLKKQMNVESNEELFSMALTLLNQCLQLEEQGFQITASTKPDLIGSRETIAIRVTPRD